jgi:hypothetical protein
MSVTNPTFMPLPLEPPDELDVPEPLLLLVLLLLLLPQAAMPIANAAAANATSAENLIRLPVTRSPFGSAVQKD